MTLVVTDTAFVQTGRADGRTVDQFTAEKHSKDCKTDGVNAKNIEKNARVFLLAAGAVEMFISFIYVSLPKAENKV